ncbi:MAG: peptidase T [Treponema sp.]|nr:peptidase T [Treponema sp.]
MITNEERNATLERFLRYVKIWTTSDGERADQGIQPSTERQWDFARILEAELKGFGLESVQITDYCYVYGFLPATPGKEHVAPICLLAHMDTVDEVSGKDVKPQLRQTDDGDTIITSDGTTLLGADDKAGVTAIMSAISFLRAHKEVSHGKIEVIFSPDEETGHGMDHVPLNLISSKCAYTVDGGATGELETECFNAYKSEITFTGKATHTGTARPDMVNAAVMASSFVANLPRHQAPETTDGYQGFYAAMSINGSMERAQVNLLLRDFSKAEMEKRKSFVDLLAQTTAASFGGKAEVTHTQQYLNMKEGLEKNPRVVKNLIAAYKAAGIEPIFNPIRGGTDGSRLTEMGIPTPNIFTGGHNFHSRDEWCSLNGLCAACEVLINLARISAEE